MSLSPGSRVGPYEIQGLVGEGGMGTVYRARDSRLDRVVALKVLRADVAADPDRQARFLQEAKAVSALNHPNIVTVHDIGTEGDVVYMVMELVEGRSLDQLIPRGGMRTAEVLRVGAQIADAFARAHATQIIHRDLKPANVMLQPDGRVKVLDFGLAKLVEAPGAITGGSMATQTARGTIVGTVAYMSPEQAEGKPVDARSDIFSFGALLYELCTGTRAFHGESQASVLADVLRQDPRPVAELRPDVPPELARLITRCLRKDPARRVQSMADLRVAFEELREDVDSGKLSSAMPVAALPAPSRRSWWLAGAAAAGAIVATVVTAVVWNPRTSTPPDAPLEPVPLTSYPGLETSPSFSPDGNQIAFIWDGERQDNADIYIKLIGPGPPLRLTTDPQRDVFPRWSPDGRQIAFIRRLDGEAFSVLLVPALGGPERRLGQFTTRIVNGFVFAALEWTTDSKFLLLAAGRGPGDPNHLQRVSVETGEIRLLLAAEANTDGYSRIVLAPDGRTLATVVGQSGFLRTHLISLSPSWEAQGARPLTAIKTSVFGLAWTADSRDLVYRIAVNLPVPLYRVSVSGGDPSPMSWVGPDASTPAVALRGERLAFARNFRDTNIWRVTLGGPENANPTIEKLAQSTFREVFPQYSPDGKRLVFFSNRSGSIQIWTSDVDGFHAVQLSNMDPFATTGSPRWSPDGRRVVFDSNAGGAYHLYEISAEGGQPKQLTTGQSSNFIGAWSPDDRWIYFSSDRSGGAEVWRMPAAGGEPEQVTRAGGQAPTVSTDNAWVYYTKTDGADGLWRMPVGGGQETKLAEAVYRYNFAPTATGVYFVTLPKPDDTSSIKFLDFKSGRVRDILSIDKPPDLGLAVSPDGRYLLFTQLDYGGIDLMLVENFK